MFCALFCTLGIKLYHAGRVDLMGQYFKWITADISTLFFIEVILTCICFRWPKKRVLRTAIAISALVCTWSVMNAGWVARTGTQILPHAVLPLFRAPANALGLIGVNLARMPAVAAILLIPSAIALTFLFFVLANPVKPNQNTERIAKKIIVCFTFIIAAILAGGAVSRQGSIPVASIGLRYNCQLRAVMSLVLPNSSGNGKVRFDQAKRIIPAFDKVELPTSKTPHPIGSNIVLIVLEGIQYSHTSLADTNNNLTPYLKRLADDNIEFTNTRSTVTHTTKALFSLLTGRVPSVSQDIAETVPAKQPYVSLATILKRQRGYRTAFFQSAKGNFEARAGLVHNLGFDKFWARDDWADVNDYLGYLACDEFAMLKPVTEWITAETKPFLLTILCSVSHDPYEVPAWFGESANEPLERYHQTILYTDKFLEALDIELEKLNLKNNTIFCVIGDHGEAFGEHGLHGHERIGFEEALKVPFCLRTPFLAETKKVTDPVSSIDLTPTLLTLLGFDISDAEFDGIDLLGEIPTERKVFFSGWLLQSPAGYMVGSKKYVLNPAAKTVLEYDLETDPQELAGEELEERQAKQIADQILNWRKDSFLKIDQDKAGKMVLFDYWNCKWNHRIASAKYNMN
jgi:arylsulfatase A-like enzyme